MQCRSRCPLCCAWGEGGEGCQYCCKSWSCRCSSPLSSLSSLLPAGSLEEWRNFKFGTTDWSLLLKGVHILYFNIWELWHHWELPGEFRANCNHQEQELWLKSPVNYKEIIIVIVFYCVLLVITYHYLLTVTIIKIITIIYGKTTQNWTKSSPLLVVKSWKVYAWVIFLFYPLSAGQSVKVSKYDPLACLLSFVFI